MLPLHCLPAELIAHYRELLRTYVIMGSGNLSDELKRLAELLVTAGLTARQTMQLHLHVLEELIHGLGTRSTPARDEPRRSAGAGGADATGRRLPPPLPRAHSSADADGAAGF